MHLPMLGGAQNVPAPTDRYILPSFEERTAYGYKRQDPYAKLFEDRIVFLGVQVDDASADDVMAQLLVLESMDPDRDIVMYINSPGGSFTAMTAIYDTMQYIRPQIQTVCLGQAASAASVLLAGGTPGKRLALPNARVLIHQPAVQQGGGQASDIEIQAAEILRMRTWLEETLSKHSNKTPEQINHDIERDKIMSAQEAVEYGLIDQVLTSRKNLPALVVVSGVVRVSPRRGRRRQAPGDDGRAGARRPPQPRRRGRPRRSTGRRTRWTTSCRTRCPSCSRPLTTRPRPRHTSAVPWSPLRGRTRRARPT